jgi:hypothetical protein
MDDLNLIDPRLAERMMSSSSGTYFQINNTPTKEESDRIYNKALEQLEIRNPRQQYHNSYAHRGYSQ